MIRLEPEWVGELLGHWAGKDWADAQQDLGYPKVSPMFSKAVGAVTEAEDVTGYSTAEGRAVLAAVDWLQVHHPEHWRALSREYKAWTRSTLAASAGDTELVLQAGKLIADFVDRLLD